MTEAPHMRHLPVLMGWIIQADRQLSSVRGMMAAPVVAITTGRVFRELRDHRGNLTASAHEVYGHTPARGDRGPSSAGAVAA